MTKKDPALAVAEMRDLLDQLIEKARGENVPAYRVAEVLETATRAAFVSGTLRRRRSGETPFRARLARGSTRPPVNLAESICGAGLASWLAPSTSLCISLAVSMLVTFRLYRRLRQRDANQHGQFGVVGKRPACGRVSGYKHRLAGVRSRFQREHRGSPEEEGFEAGYSDPGAGRPANLHRDRV
jgi:hypothetical protein